MPNKIIIKGARVHNLKNIDVEIPKNKLVVITGLSGSGKSSLAFDTIYAEGQRRYVESLSSYARQFLGSKSKPDVDSIQGLSPTIALDQRSIFNNPRSTVGTITDIYDYLRVLYARIGQPHCPKCGKLLKKQTKEQIIKSIAKTLAGQEVLILSPIIRDRRGEHLQVLRQIGKTKYKQVRIDGDLYINHNLDDIKLEDQKRHTIEIVIDNFVVPYSSSLANTTADKSSYFAKAINTAVDMANGSVAVYNINQDANYFFTENLACFECNVNLESIQPRLFSFNSPKGACVGCKGLGTRLDLEADLLVPNNNLTIAEGAIRPFSRLNGSSASSQFKILGELGRKYDFSVHTVWKKLTQSQCDIILRGEANGQKPIKKNKDKYPGIINILLKKYESTDSEYIRSEISKYMRIKQCQMCHGRRLQPSALSVLIAEKNISEVCQMTILDNIDFFKKLELSPKDKTIGQQAVKEIIARLKLVLNAGLGYLTLDRSSETLSGGESQRTKLATQIGSGLSGVIYVLDEPSIGLHQKDNDKLISTLKKLKQLDNTVIVVEHDEATILASDWVIDIGPGAGKHGGYIIAQGEPKKLLQNKNSLTANYISGRNKIKLPVKTHAGSGKKLEIIGAAEFNLQNIDVCIPLGKLVCVTGVSGSGKSTLITDILSKALAQKFYRAKETPGKHQEIKGIEFVNKVVTIDQSPIGRTPRSNPATYTGVFTYVRDLFTKLPESRIKSLTAGHFSFNVKGGRCEACEGDGVMKVEMHFLPDVYVDCEECRGRRYRSEVLEIYYKEKNIADILEMTVEEALEFFKDIVTIYNKLKILDDVGLGYIHLGQPATTLSGGEAQRIKLAAELSRRATGRTLYILDEPTTGLHFEDIKKLLGVLNRLVDKGNTVLVIEHNLDVIKGADWIIDLGPGGGDKGGQIVVAGTAKDVANCSKSYTGQYLKKVL
ncbi:MAG: excinuclease ABC subunit UvrA [Candidatus Kuenenbacteria bacterium]